MLRRVNASRDSQNFLRSRDAGVVDKAWPKDIEPGTEMRARKQREHCAPWPSVQIQAKRRLELTNRADLGRQNARHIRISFKHADKPSFHYNGNLKIGPGLFQKMDGRSRKNAIAKRPQPDDRDAAARIEPRESVGLSGH